MYFRRTKSKGLQPAGISPGGASWSCCSSARTSDHVGIQVGLFARRRTHREVWGRMQQSKIVVHLPERRLVTTVDAQQGFQSRTGRCGSVELGELVLDVRLDLRRFLCRGSLCHQGMLPTFGTIRTESRTRATLYPRATPTRKRRCL